MGRRLPGLRLVRRPRLPGPTAVAPPRCFRQPGPSVRQARADPPPALFIYRTTRKHGFRLCLMCPRFGGFGLQGSDFVDNDEITQTISV